MKQSLSKKGLIGRTFHREPIGGVAVGVLSHSHFVMALTAGRRLSQWKLKLMRQKRWLGAAVNKPRPLPSATEHTAEFEIANHPEPNRGWS
jgi:hypothetical protein